MEARRLKQALPMFYCSTTNELKRLGLRQLQCIPHAVSVFNKAYPDSQLLLEKRGFQAEHIAPKQFRQINLCCLRDFNLPNKLYVNKALNWHQQQIDDLFLIASAGVFIHGEGAIVTVMQSDVLQQLFRCPDIGKTKKNYLDERMKAWPKLLVNALLDLAIKSGVLKLFIPTADLVVKTCAKKINPKLYQRIYDFVVKKYSVEKVKVMNGDYWCISIAENAKNIVALEEKLLPRAPRSHRPLVNICHLLTNESPSIRQLLELHARYDLRETYVLFADVFRESFDVAWERDSCEIAIPLASNAKTARKQHNQLQGLFIHREKDLSLADMQYHNFEWCVYSAPLHAKSELKSGIVLIPADSDPDYSQLLANLQQTKTGETYSILLKHTNGRINPVYLELLGLREKLDFLHGRDIKNNIHQANRSAGIF